MSTPNEPERPTEPKHPVTGGDAADTPAAHGQEQAGQVLPGQDPASQGSPGLDSPGQGEASYPPPEATVPADPERGLRGVMSAILIFEAIAILLGLTVIANGGTSAPGWQIGVIVAVALAHIVTPAVIKKRYAVALIFVLQAILIACWAIDGAIGVTGIVFLVVWVLILVMRREFRRRIAGGTAAGTIAGQ